MARILDIYAIQATLTGVDDVIRKLGAIRAALGRTQMALASVSLAGAVFSATFLTKSVQAAFAFDRLAGAIRRVWAGEGPGMVEFVQRLSVRTGIAVEVLGRAAEVMGSMGISAGRARRILQLATEIAAARELPAERVGDIAEQIARLQSPALRQRALRMLQRLGLPLEGLTGKTPQLQERVLARLEERFKNALGAFRELDSILDQVRETVRLFVITSGMPIIRLFGALSGGFRPLNEWLMRLQQVTHGWAGLGAILAVVVISVRQLVILWRTVIAAQVQMAAAATLLANRLGSATTAMGAAALGGAGAAAAGAAVGTAGILARFAPLLRVVTKFLGPLGIVASIAWIVWDIVSQRKIAGREQDQSRDLKKVAENTKESADSLKEIARSLIGGGTRTQRTFSQVELEIALSRLLSRGVI